MVFKAIAFVLAKLTPQPFEAVTDTTPEAVKPLLKVIVAMFVPCPAVTVAPVGAVQLYDVAPAIAVAVYTTTSPGQALVAGAVSAVGLAGATRFTWKSLYKLAPHVVTARTFKLEVMKALPKETVIVFVPCPLTIVIPAGAIHWKVVLATAGVE